MGKGRSQSYASASALVSARRPAHGKLNEYEAVLAVAIDQLHKVLPLVVAWLLGTSDHTPTCCL